MAKLHRGVLIYQNSESFDPADFLRQYFKQTGKVNILMFVANIRRSN